MILGMLRPSSAIFSPGVEVQPALVQYNRSSQVNYNPSAGGGASSKSNKKVVYNPVRRGTQTPLKTGASNKKA
jgi:hypothetical protein